MLNFLLLNDIQSIKDILHLVWMLDEFVIFILILYSCNVILVIVQYLQSILLKYILK